METLETVSTALPHFTVVFYYMHSNHDTKSPAGKQATLRGLAGERYFMLCKTYLSKFAQNPHYLW